MGSKKGVAAIEQELATIDKQHGTPRLTVEQIEQTQIGGNAYADHDLTDQCYRFISDMRNKPSEQVRVLKVLHNIVGQPFEYDDVEALRQVIFCQNELSKHYDNVGARRSI
jgi:hypothetical protein